MTDREWVPARYAPRREHDHRSPWWLGDVAALTTEALVERRAQVALFTLTALRLAGPVLVEQAVVDGAPIKSWEFRGALYDSQDVVDGFEAWQEAHEEVLRRAAARGEES